MLIFLTFRHSLCSLHSALLLAFMAYITLFFVHMYIPLYSYVNALASTTSTTVFSFIYCFGP